MGFICFSDKDGIGLQGGRERKCVYVLEREREGERERKRERER